MEPVSKTYQDWCIDTLLFIFQNRRYYDFTEKDKGYRYAVNAILTNHASMYYFPNCKAQKNYINLWWDHLNQSNVGHFFEPLLMSRSASRIIMGSDSQDSYIRVNKGEVKDKLHFEHITPNGVIIEQIEHFINTSTMDRNKLSALLKYHKLVLLTRDERDQYLDGAVDTDGHFTTFQQEDFDLLSRWDAGIPPMAKIGDKCKALGNGPLRLAHLVNKGVSFVLHGQIVNPGSFSDFEGYFCEPFRITI